MPFRRYGAFAGGIDLPDQKQATEDAPIEPYRPSGTLRVPLAPCGSRPAAPLVELGQEVSPGRQIAQAASPLGVAVFSPVAGLVKAITTAEVAAGDGFSRVPAIEIAPHDELVALAAAPEQFDWRVAGAVSLRQRIAAGALTTYRRPVTSLSSWVARARAKGCTMLVANAMESQPYVTADHRLLVEYGPEVIGGLAILARAIQVTEVVIAVDRRRTDRYQDIIAPARACDITRVALPHKYPTGADPMLAKVLTRRERPPGGSVMDIGVAIVSPATCLAVYRWVACGLAATGRVVTIAGQRAPQPANRWVPFGASCLGMIGDVAQPVIHNGPMVGLRCPSDGVVSPSTDAILAMATAVPASPSPCIRCSWCSDHCPARLNVASLNDAFELSNLAQAAKLVASACVECGVCSYVCPARLPLSQRVRQLKRALSDMEEAMPLFTGR